METDTRLVDLAVKFVEAYERKSGNVMNEQALPTVATAFSWIVTSKIHPVGQRAAEDALRAAMNRRAAC